MTEICIETDGETWAKEIVEMLKKTSPFVKTLKAKGKKICISKDELEDAIVGFDAGLKYAGYAVNDLWMNSLETPW